MFPAARLLTGPFTTYTKPRQYRFIAARCSSQRVRTTCVTRADIAWTLADWVNSYLTTLSTCAVPRIDESNQQSLAGSPALLSLMEVRTLHGVFWLV